MSRNHEEIVDTEVSNELSESFLEYSMSVIVSRALPDVRDGLKPVHRRILWSMYSQGMRPERGYNKCARATGDIMGKYHPHGDSAIYDALVRLAQPWSMRIPLIDGHGNFGSLDDGPAAARYTECRLSLPSMSMVTELEENTVDFRPNYDGREKEPIVLPASFPNLLVNGSTGIAVGMATNMPSHNLGEVIDATVAMIYDPKITLEEIIKFIPGPDFPTGGLIVGREGIYDAYKNGKGSFKIRSKVKFENDHGKKRAFVFSELPYGVGPEKVIARIKDLVSDKKLLGISDVKNYSDRKVGLKLVVELKNGFDQQQILDDLYRLTPLEEGFSVSNVALVNNQPRTLGIIQIIRYYIEYRLEVVKRRTEFRLSKAENRAHILEGLIVALKGIEEVVALIKGSKDTASARKKLRDHFSLSEVQAEAILEMTLRRLTSLEVSKLMDEHKELQRNIKELKKILASDKVLKDLVAEELILVKGEFNEKRKTEILEKLPDNQSVVIPAGEDKEVFIYFNSKGQIFTSFSLKKLKVSDQITYSSNSMLSKNLIAITSKGKAYMIPIAQIPVKNQKITDLIQLDSREEVVGLVKQENKYIILVSKNGVVKKILTEEIKRNSVPIIKFKGLDELIGAFGSDEADSKSEESLLTVTSDGMGLRFPTAQVSVQGLSATGILGMKMKGGSIIYSNRLENNYNLGFHTNLMGVKIIPESEIPVKNRGGQGFKLFAAKKGETEVLKALCGEKISFSDDEGKEIDIKLSKRESQSVISKNGVKGLQLL